MLQAESLRVVEALRKGIPPVGHLDHFTVGRRAEIDRLSGYLNGSDPSALLLKANYGAGKSHLLHLIREKALKANYAVSFVTLDAKSGVKFNRMDQMTGAILRAVETPGKPGEKGLHAPFALFSEASERSRAASKGRPTDLWGKMSNGWKWDFSDSVVSEPLFVALRAWLTGVPEARDLAASWLHQPHDYTNCRKALYLTLVSGLRSHFRDPRSDWQFYKADIFSMQSNGYQSCWGTIRSMHELLVAAGLKGLIVLFDEFEDVLTNINNVAHQEAAFWNLFLFFRGTRFLGKTFYAVTPDFTRKCKDLLLNKGRFDFDYSMFDTLPTFEMSPLDARDLEDLAVRIRDAHAMAYGYSQNTVTPESLKQVVRSRAQSPVQDRARLTIRQVVSYLDDAVQ